MKELVDGSNLDSSSVSPLVRDSVAAKSIGEPDWVGLLNSKNSECAGFERLCTDVKSFMLKNVKGFGSKDHPKAMVCALSGGIDSMMLCAAVHKVCQKEHLGKIKLHMVHINHNLQEASKSFEQHCAFVSKKMGWTYCVKNVYLNDQSGLKTEGEARLLRRAALAQYAMENEIEYVFFGNHADDLIEGHLLTLSRGGALSGLAGFSAKSELKNTYLSSKSSKSNEDVNHEGEASKSIGNKDSGGSKSGVEGTEGAVVYALRPLIGIGKKQLTELIEQIALPYVEDPTNAQSDYERNALRHSLAKNWDVKRPGWRKAAVRSLELLAQERSLLAEYKKEHLKRLTTLDGKLNVEELTSLSKEMGISLLHDWSATKIGQSLHESHLSALYDFFVQRLHSQGNKMWKFKDWEFNVKNGFLSCEKDLKTQLLYENRKLTENKTVEFSKDSKTIEKGVEVIEPKFVKKAKM